MLDSSVGLSLALGGMGGVEKTVKKIESIAKGHHATNSGIACLMLLANSYGRTSNNIDGKEAKRRNKNIKAFSTCADLAENADLKLACIAAAVVSPIDGNLPIIDKFYDRFTETSNASNLTAVEPEQLVGRHSILTNLQRNRKNSR